MVKLKVLGGLSFQKVACTERLEKLNRSRSHCIFSHCVNWMIFFTLVFPSPSSICNCHDKTMHNLNCTKLPADKLEVWEDEGSRCLRNQFLNSVWCCIFNSISETLESPLVESTLLCGAGQDAQECRSYTLKKERFIQK